jgi:hypothetical protein
MRIVIQCASDKDPDASSLVTADCKPVLFVASPVIAPPSSTYFYARPDDVSDDGNTWRQLLVEYNDKRNFNALNLLPAYRLYEKDVYRKLVDKFGLAQVFILSAGWGLISADFLTPRYDITFSANAEPYKQRRKEDNYRDLCMIPDNGDDMLFVGGKAYLPLFCKLTAGLRGRKTVFFNSKKRPVLPFCFDLIRYETTTRTNWHYECCKALLEGKLAI